MSALDAAPPLAIVGAGTMGSGIAQVAALGGGCELALACDANG